MLLLACTAEEKGLLGSRYYSENPPVPLNQIVFNLNSDGGGYNDISKASIMGLTRTNAEEAMTSAARVAVMDEGRIIQVATPARIYETPNSVYVADFIGDVNIIKGTAKPAADAQYQIDWTSNEAPLMAASETPFSDGQQCHLAIRPEKIAITTSKPDGKENAVQGKVLDIAYLGNLSTYHVELAGGQVIKAQTANTRRIARRDITWEDKVWVSWSATAGVLLDQ